jgi:hypothetical protein
MQCVIESRILSRADWHRAGLLLLAGVIAHFLYLMVLSDALPMEQWNWMGGDTESYLRPA